MKKGLYTLLHFLIALLGWGGYEVVAQKRIDVTIKFNTTSGLYEVYGRPNFTDPAFGVGAGTQISIVLPASVADNPLLVTPVNGGAWSDVSHVYAPTADPAEDFHGVATAGNYVSVVSGQEILFFTFGVTGVCLPGVRLFENASDPPSSAPGFSGGDYKNYIGDALSFGDDTYQSNYYAPGGICPAQNPPYISGKELVTNVNTPGSVCLPVSDPDGTTSFTVAICGQPANGTVSAPPTINGSEVCVSYTPPANFTGNAGTACVIVTDPTGLTSVAYVPIVVNPLSGTTTAPQPPVVTVVPITTPVNTTATQCLPVSSPNGYTSFTATICGQPTNGTVTVVSSGTGSVCLKYTPPTNFTGNAGNVCVKVTDPAGLTSVVTVPIEVTPKPTPGGPNPPEITTAHITTYVNQPGSVCLPVTDPDGTTAFTVTVCGGPTSGTATVPATLNGNSLCVTYTPPTNFTGNAGNLCLIVTDPTGLTAQAYVPITVLPGNTTCPTITNLAANNTNPSSCSGTNGSIVICGITAATSYSISYSKNGVAQTSFTQTANASGCLSLTGLTAGTYSGIQVANAACTAGSNSLGPITLSDPGSPAPPSLTLTTASSTVCSGQSITLTAGGATGATFTFSGPGLGTPSGNSVVATPTVLGAAVYTVSQSVSGCTSPVASVSIGVNAQPVISSVTPANPTACGTSTGSLTLNGLTPSTSYTISYSYNGGAPVTATLTSNASGQVTISGLAAGIYTGITATNGGCTSSAQTASLSDPSAPAAPTITANPSTSVICLGQSVTLTASGTGTSFTFLGPGTITPSGTSVIVTPTSIGNAVYTATQSASGCTSPAASLTVTVNAQPTISSVTPMNPSSCSGTNGSLALNGLTPSTSYTISYSYNGGAAITQTVVTNASGVATLTGLQAGAYTNIIVSANGCSSAAQTATLSDPGAPSAPALTFNPASGSLCLGQSLTLTASGTAGSTFTFSGPGLGAVSGNSVVATPTSIGTAVYTVSQSVSGCTSSAASQTVVVNSQPVITSVTTANPTACGTSTGSLTLNGLTPSATYSVSYSYNGGAAITATLTSNASGQVTISGLAAGAYSAITVNNGSCTSSAQTASLSDPTAPVAPTLTANPASSVICLGQSITLTAAGSGGTFTFSGPGLSSTTGSTVTATPTTVGSAVYTVTQTASGCTSPAASYTVTVNAPPAISSVTPTNPSSCSGTNGSLALNGLTPSTSYTISYSYNGGAAVTQTVVTNASGVATLTGLQAGAYTNIIAGVNGCSSTAQTATLSDPGAPATPTFTLNPASGSLCLGQSLTLTASGATGAVFTFSGPGLSTPSGNSVVATPSSIGTAVYTVSQSLSGCTSSAASQTVIINAQPAVSSITPTNPTSCGTATGSLLLSGLSPSSTYTVSYSKNGGSPITATLSSNGSGQIAISGLSAGSYAAITVAQGICTSVPSSGTVTLTDPTPPALTPAQVTGISPTSCGSATGRIDITGLPASTSVVIGYSKNGTPTSATVNTNASGQASILNLTAGTYTAFTVQTGACTSAPYAGPVQLTDPGLTPLTAANIANTNPTSCGSSDAQITLSGLPASTTMTITYQVNGTAVSANVTTNASGQVVIPNLKAGNYTVIAYTIGACTSAPYNGTVVINDPSVTPLTSANVTAFNPTSCSTTDGRIELTGLVSNVSTVITYKKNGTAVNTTVTSDASGKATISNLGIGTYTDFSYSQGSCTSAPYAGSLVVNGVNCNQNPPYIRGKELVTNVNTPGSVCLPVSDPDGTTSFTVAICGQPANGTVSAPPTINGSEVCVSYTPPANFTGNAGTACVIVTDPTGLTSVAYVPIVVNPLSGTTTAPQPPLVTVVPITTPVNTTATQCLPVSSPNGYTSFTAIICGQPTNGTVTVVSSGTGSVCLAYTPPTNFTGNAGNVCVKVTDPAGLTSVVQVPIEVTPKPTPGGPNPPEITTAHIITYVNQPGSVCLGVKDPDGTTSFTVTVCGGPTNGTATVPLTVNGNSLCVTYTPPMNFTGNAGNLCLIVTDPTGLTAQAYVPITVLPGNQPVQHPPYINGKSLVTNVNTPGSVCLPVSDPDGTTAFTVAICGQPANGTATVPATVNGTEVCVNYTPPTNFTGNAGTVCVIVTDPTGLTSVAYVPVVVNPFSGTAVDPKPPVVTIVDITTPVNTTALQCLPVSSPNGYTSFTATICGQPANGTVVVVGGGPNSVCLKYTPPTNFTGNAGEVCVKVTDPAGLTSVVTVPITVTPKPNPSGPNPPEITTAPIITYVNQPNSVCLPVKDVDGTTSFTVTLCGQPTNGTVVAPATVNGNSLCLSYTPPTNFTGNAGHACVIVTDPTGLTAQTYVSITVLPGNQPKQNPPYINGKPLVTNVNQPGSVCLPVSDPDGTTSYTVAICGQPANGTVTVPATVNGTEVCVNYTPPANFTGNAGTACVIVTDPTGLTSVAYVPIVVNPLSVTTTDPKPPVVTVVTITTPINTTAIQCLPVSSPNGYTSFTATICGQPANGTVVVVGSGTNSVCLKYTPPTNFTGNAGEVCVKVTDPAGLTSVVTVPVIVTPKPTTGGPNRPEITTAPIITYVNQPKGICLPVIDADGTTAFTVTVCGGPTNGTATVPTTVNGNQLCVNYTPPTNFTGNAGNLCLIVTDPTGLTAQTYVSITVLPGNQPTQNPPDLTGKSLVTNINTPGSVCLPVTDPDGTTAYTVAICGQPANGTATVPATVNGTEVCVNYTPPASFTGYAGMVCVIVTDPTGLTSVAYVPVVVNPMSRPDPNPKPPVVTIVDITTPINTTAIQCLPVSSPNGYTSFTATICGQPANGTVVVVSSGTNSVCLKYTPPTNFTGNAGGVCVKVTDPAGLTSVVTVPITVTPKPTPGKQNPPEITTAPIVTYVNQPGGVCLGLKDPDGTTSFTVALCGQPANGTVVAPSTVNGNQLCLQYTPPANFTGNAGTVCVIVTDPTGLTSVGYVSITVVPGNQPNQNPPVTTDETIITNINTPGSTCLKVIDPDGTTSFTAAICGQPTNGTATVPATFTGNQLCVNYTPPTSFTGYAGTICVVITDPTGLTTTSHITVVVNPVCTTATSPELPPVIVNKPITTPQDTPKTVCLDLSDPNGTTSFTAAICNQPANGTVTIVSTTSANVCLQYTPPAGFTGLAGYACVIVTDPTGLSSVVNVPIIVTPVCYCPARPPHPPKITGTSLVTNQNQPGRVCLYVSDDDGTTSFTVTACGLPDSGTATIPATVNGNLLCIDYMPAYNFSGNAGTICLIVTDPTGLTATALVPVTVIPNVAGCVTMNLKVLLEGPYNSSTHLMNTTLNQRGLLPGQTPVGNFAVATPAGQPYNTAPWNYTGTESMSSYAPDIVDWVLVSLRTDSLTTQSVFKAAGLLHSDGRITFVRPCFTIPSGSYFAVIEHRNHMGVMTPRKVAVSSNAISFDFTQQDSYMITDPPSFGQINLDGKWLMYGADGKKDSFTDDFDINFFDSKLWKDESGIFDQYKYGDFNMDADVNFSDSVLWNKNNGRYSKVPH